MKHLLLSLALVCFLSSVNSQTGYWTELGGVSPVRDSSDVISCLYYDSLSGSLYAPFFENATGSLVLAKWSGGAWQIISSGTSIDSNDLSAGPVTAVTEDRSGNIYIAGLFSVGQEYNVVEWDGSNWSVVGGLDANNYINTLSCDNNGNLYAAGWFCDNTGHGYVSKWDGSNWSELGPPGGLFSNGGPNFTVASTATDQNNNVYASGCYWYQGEPQNEIFEWGGSVWAPLDSNGLPSWGGLNGYTFCIGRDGKFYGMGQNGGDGNHPYVAAWNGRWWAGLGNYSPNIESYLSICAIDSNHVFADANDTDATGSYFINAWNGTAWNELGTNNFALHANGYIQCVACSNVPQLVFAAGNFTDAKGYSYVAEYVLLNEGNLSIFLTPDPVNCTLTGSINAAVNGGTPPFTYEWSNGDSTANIDSLAAGYYYVTVQDGAGHTALGYTQVLNNCVYFVNGIAYNDSALNCSYHNNSIPVPGMTLELVSATGVSYNAYTDSLGQFSFRVPDSGTYILNTYVNNYGQCCQIRVCGSTGDTINLTGPPGDTLNNVLIGVSNGTFDLTMHMSWAPANPGFQKNYWVYPANLSTVPVTGPVTIVFTYDTSLIYLSAQAPLPVVDTIAHTVTWTVNGSSIPSPGFGPYLAVNFFVPSTLSLNYQLQSSFVIYPFTGDCDTTNNRYTFIQPVTGSHDPNSKQVSPSGDISPNDSIFTYTINYQNTGTDSTYFVVVRDTLSPYLEPASVQNIASSSNYSAFSVSGTGALTWTFDPLRLPYKSIDSVGSQGFIMFRVKKKPNTPYGAAVSNTASVYFDYNPAVITNTVTDSVLHIVYNDITAAICSGDTFSIDTFRYTYTGYWSDTLLTNGGYDSIINLYLTVASTLNSLQPATLCTGDSMLFNNRWYNTAGTYYDTLTATGGCDSIAGLALGFYAPPQVTFTWDSLSYMNGPLIEQFYGSVMHPDTVGVWCLFIHPNPVPLVLKGGNPEGGTYSGNYIINDILYVDSGSFPLDAFDTITYSYTDLNGCSASTVTYFLLTACEGIAEATGGSISVYPNPATDQLFIKTQNIQPISTTVYDVNGRIIYTMPFKPIVDVNQLSNGVYFIEVTSNEGVARKKFVKM